MTDIKKENDKGEPKTKKLELNKETLKDLSTPHEDRVKGGRGGTHAPADPEKEVAIC